MSPDPTTTMAETNNTEEIWQDALCILHGFHWPFRVEVSSKLPDQLGGNIPARTIRLSAEGLRILKKKHKIPTYRLNVPDTLVVPEQCIIRPVLPQPNPPGFSPSESIFGDDYTPITLANVNIGDFLAWGMEPTYSTCSGVTEIIPCTLNFAGISTTDPIEIYAFVCLQKVVLSGFKAGKTEDDINMHRVPISRIYRWDDINQARRTVSQQLGHVQLDLMELKLEYDETHYGFSYTVSKSQKTRPSENLNDMAKVQEEHAKLSAWVAKDSKNKGYDLKGGEHLTKEKIPKDADFYNNFDKKRENSGLVRVHDTSANSKGEGDVSVSPRSDQSWNPSRNQDDGNSKENYTDETKKKKHSSSSNENNELQKIVVFGNCFMKDTKCSKIKVEGIEKGDTVIASLKDRDDVIGKVSLTCDLPSINPNQIFIGVHFEENINAEPFEIRHIYGGDENTCFKKCEGTVKVYIPVELLSADTSSTQACLRVLKAASKGKFNDRKRQLSVSDIQVDYNYEANRSGTAANPIKFVEPKNLKNMGIEGYANSCYLDAVIFALYAFTGNFDEGLLYESLRNVDHSTAADKLIKIDAARNVLKYDIVTPLRNAMKVSWANVYKFRRVLAEILNDNSYLGNFMDTEAFITSLFSQVLRVPEFFVLGEDTKDYILQLFPPMSTDENEDKKETDHACVQHLLQEYFKWADVKLQDVPRSGFIIKLPVSNGVPHFKHVYPNLKLRLGKRLLDKKDKAESKVDLNLRAVICLQKSHFTCFVRVETGDGGKPMWYFHDSMATESILTECRFLEDAVETIAPNFTAKTTGNGYPEGSDIPKEAEDWLQILLKTAYICVYEPPYNETYV